jgi:glutamine synthetase adenylyltransferase
MNLDLILPALAPLLPLVIAPAAATITEAAKRVPAVPFDGRTKATILAALLAVSLLLRVAIAWVTGTLDHISWADELRVLVDAIIAALTAAGGYALLTSSKPNV